MAEEHEPALDEKSRKAWIVGICAFTGLWGILTGFAVFILIRTGDFSDPVIFVIGLCVAALASSVVEALRETLRGEISVHPTRRVTSVVVTIVTLLIFELFVLASHNAIDIFGDPREVTELREALLGPAFTGASSATIDLIVLAIIWVITGSVVGLALGLFVVREDVQQTMRERTVRGALTGVAAATIAAPILVLVYVIVWRLCAAVALGITAPAALAAHYDSVVSGLGNFKFAGVAAAFIDLGTFAIFGLLKLWVWSVAGKLIVAVLIIATIAIGKRYSEWRPLGIVAIGCLVGITAPLLLDFGDVFKLAVLAAVVWFVPGLVLGIAAPLLEEPSDRANIWAIIATLLGLIVAILTVVRWHELAARNVLFAALAVAFFAAAVVFARLRDLREFWPALALCLSAIAASLTFLLVSLTASFHGVLAEVATIDLLPASIAPSPAMQRLQGDAAGYAEIRRIKTRTLPAGEDPAVDYATFQSIASTSRADRAAQFAATRAAILAARSQAVQQLAAVARRGRPPVILSARVLDDAAAVRAFQATADGIARAHMSSAQARLRAAATESGRVAADADQRWWSGYMVDVDIAAQRVTSGDDVLADMAQVTADDAPAEARIAQDRAFSASAAPEQLEVSLAGSFAFWLTVGLLSAWAIRRRRAPEAGATD